MESPGRTSTTRFGVFELDRHSGELRKGGSRIKLQIQPLKVLVALLEQPGTVVTREELKRQIWPNDSFGDFDHAVNVAVAKLRAALSDSADTPRYVETLPRRGYRFIFPVTPANGGLSTPASPETEPAPARASRAKSSHLLAIAAVALGILAVAGSTYAWWTRSHRSHWLSDRDTVVLADFSNSTGDPVFDGTLRQGLSVQLEQSPFLRLVTDERIRETLLLMGKAPDARITPDIARQLCQRTESAAVLDGSIASLGKQYVVGLKAVNCQNGEVLAEEQATADAKEDVLYALAGASGRLRGKLGESLMTVAKFNTPFEQVTTPSLDALQAYSLGRTTMIDKDDQVAAITLFQHAIELDPNFAMAYASLGMAYGHLSEKQSLANFRMAYDLRDRVSERERFYIEAHYHEAVTGDWLRARQVYELWAQTYPRDDIAHFNLSNVYLQLAQFDKAHEQANASLRLLPGDCLSSANVLGALLGANRLDEAAAFGNELHGKNLACVHAHYYLYQLAFLRHDAAGMAEQVALGADKYGTGLLPLEALTAAYYGQMKRARELFRRSINSAEQSKQVEFAALLAVRAAEEEALLGDPSTARQEVAAALALSSSRTVEGLASFTLAVAGNDRRAQSLADDLAKRFPLNTQVQSNLVPVARAQIALHRNEPDKAVQALREAALYEFGDMEHANTGFPAYLRGQAYLAAQQGAEAVAEFQKVLAHSSVIFNEPIGALAQLGLARAYALQGDPGKAKIAYVNFLTLWKDADPDLPLLLQAKAESAKLH
jgi:DNA-binding winged helix-turn-helix (wHTH) protein/tetratricopeptide (TPR) repeat protein